MIESPPYFSHTALKQLLVLALSCTLVLPLTRLVTSIRSTAATKRNTSAGEPPMVPYWIPFVGNLFTFLKNPAELSSNVLRSFPYAMPVRIRLGPVKMTILSGSSNIVTLFRSSRAMSTKPGMLIALKNIFGTPTRVIPFYAADDSGMSSRPYEGSKCKPEHRIIYFQQKAAHKHLSGPGLIKMADRYMTTLAKQFSQLNIDHEWVEMPDLYHFLQMQIARASIEAMCGEYILRLNPTLVEDFWAFDRSVGTLLKGLPRWMCSREYGARDKLLASVKKWHAFAHQRTDCNKTGAGDPDWEPYFGHKLVKERQKYSLKMDAMDADARASEDMGLIFAGNTNAVPAAFWFILEAFKDPSLLSRLREEVAHDQRSQSEYSIPDINVLCGGQLLQSVYAETLRLRVAILVTRAPEHEDFQLGDYIFPKDNIIALSSRTAAMDELLWNAGSTQQPHALDQFWAERFLVYPNDPTSGPLRNKRTGGEGNGKAGSEAYFSMEGLSGGWIPYGGGQRMCPGRHFAKQEIIGTFALVSQFFDIELLTPQGFVFEADMKYFPLGGLPPTKRIPFRIRGRKQQF